MSDYLIVEQLSQKQLQQLTELFGQMWWSKDRTSEEIAVMLKNSLSFAVIVSDTQDLAGYARVLTDGIKYAFIFDVMAFESHRGLGLGRALLEAIIAHPKLRNVTHFDLTCAPDMVAFYEKFGFSENYGVEVRPMRYSRTIG